MRIITFILCTLFFQTILLAQKEKEIGFGFHLNANFSFPVHSDRDVVEGDNGSSFGFGADIYYDINERIQLVSSLGYLRQTVSQSDYSLIFFCDLNPIMGAEPDLTDRSRIVESYDINYLGIAAALRFKILGERNHLYARAGVAALFQIAYQASFTLVECGVVESPIAGNPRGTPKTFVYEFRTGLGYEFGMGKKVKLFLEPQAKISINRLMELDALIQSENHFPRVFNLGILMGLRF